MVRKPDSISGFLNKHEVDSIVGAGESFRPEAMKLYGAVISINASTMKKNVKADYMICQDNEYCSPTLVQFLNDYPEIPYFNIVPSSDYDFLSAAQHHFSCFNISSALSFLGFSSRDLS